MNNAWSSITHVYMTVTNGEDLSTVALDVRRITKIVGTAVKLTSVCDVNTNIRDVLYCFCDVSFKHSNKDCRHGC